MRRSFGVVAVLCSCAFDAGLVAAAPRTWGGSVEETPQQTTRVVLVASPAMEPLVVRFIAELSSLDVEVVRAADDESEPSLAGLEELAGAHEARVAVRVRQAGSAVDLWLVNPRTHELVYRRVVADGDRAVLVLRSLEILRGALLDLRAVADEPAPSAASKRPPPPLPLPAPARAMPPPLWLGLSGALLAPHGGESLGGGATLALRRRIDWRFSLHTEVLVPFEAWSVAGRGGFVDVWMGGATLAGMVTPWSDHWISPGVGLGLGAVAIHTRGEAQVGYRGSSALNAAFFPHARLDVALRLSAWLRVRWALTGGFASPRPVLLFAREREESWLNPLLLSSLGVEIALR